MVPIRKSVFYSCLAALVVLNELIATSDGWSGSSLGIIESGQVYLVALDKIDCPDSTNCDTLAFYSAMNITDVVDVTFAFLPGIHNLSQTWFIANSVNITLRSWDGFSTERSGPRNEVRIACESNFTGSELLRVNESERVFLDDISILFCEDIFFALRLSLSQEVALSNVRLNCSNSMDGGNLSFWDVHVQYCRNVTIVNSTFDSCHSGVGLINVDSAVIERVSLFSHYSCDGLNDSSPSYGVGVINASDITIRHASISTYCRGIYWRDVHHGVVANVEFFDNYEDGLYARNSLGNVTFERLTFQGCSYGIALFGVFDDVSYTIDSVSVTSGTSHSRAGLYLQNWPHAGLYAAVQTLRIHNVTVSNVAPTSLEELEDSFYAAIVVYFLKTVTMSNVTVENNGLTGMHIIDSTVFLRDDILVKKNSGISGGGMSLSANSVLVMDSSTRLQLFGNHANQFGGGIYVSQDYTWQLRGETYAICFVCSLDEVVEPIAFQGNTAGITGDDLYGGFVKGCFVPVVNGNMPYSVNTTDDIIANNCSQTKISSDPVRVLLCNNRCVEGNVSDTPTQHTIEGMYPGEEFSLNLAAVGQENGLTQAVISLTSEDIILHSDHLRNGTERVEAKCTNLSYILELPEYVAQARLQVAIEDENLPAYINVPIEVTIYVLPCPLGFNLSSNTCRCSDLLESPVTCDIRNKTLYRETRDPWISLKAEYTILFKHCPFDYCASNKSIPVDDLDQQCDSNRRGILCGECMENYSLILGSNECRDCSNQVWRAVLIVLGSALVGIGLIAVLIALDLTVTAGTLNGLVFFANVVKIYEPLFPSSQRRGLLHYSSSWLNLDLGIPSCFVDQMEACGKVGLQFVFPLYLVTLVIAIMIICKAGQSRGFSSFRLVRLMSQKLTVLIGPKAISVLATVLLLSYTKLYRIVILVFHRATLQKNACNQTAPSSNCGNETVWSVDGNIGYLSGCHGGLFGVAVGIVTPLLVLYTLFLLFFPLMERHFPRFRRLRSWHMLLKPWYDAYGGPYKDRYRSWNGVLLLARAGLALFPALVHDPVVNLTVLGWVSLFLVSALFLTRPYKAFHNNFLEMLFLSCLLLMAFVATTANDGDEAQINLLLSVALITLVLIALYHAYLQLKKLKSMASFPRVFKNIWDNVRNTICQKVLDERSDVEEEQRHVTVESTELPETCYFRDSFLNVDEDFKPIN